MAAGQTGGACSETLAAACSGAALAAADASQIKYTHRVLGKESNIPPSHSCVVHSATAVCETLC